MEHWIEAEVTYSQPRSILHLAMRVLKKIGSMFSNQEVTYKKSEYCILLEKKDICSYYIYSTIQKQSSGAEEGQNSLTRRLYLFILTAHPRYSFKCVSTVGRHLSVPGSGEGTVFPCFAIIDPKVKLTCLSVDQPYPNSQSPSLIVPWRKS